METKKTCPTCGSKTGFDFIYLLAGGVAIAVIGLILLGMCYSIYWEQFQGNNLPVTALGELREGTTVKISGIIVSSEKVVIEKKATGAGRAYNNYWELDNFRVNDTSHEILVDIAKIKSMDNLNYIADGAHKEGYEYWAGDEISVIGTVVEDTNGNTALEAKFIATSPETFGEAGRGDENQGIIAMIIGLLLAVGAGVALFIRKKAHMEKFNPS